MATLTTHVASFTVAASPVRVQAAAHVQAAAPAKRRFAQFLTLLMRALGAVHC
jgi:hypothetical protein